MPRLLRALALLCCGVARGLEVLARALPRRAFGAAVALVPLAAAAPLAALARDQELLEIGVQAPVQDEKDVPFTTLPSGVKVKTLRAGAGEPVTATSTVLVECTGRLLNLNGVKFYSTNDLASAKSLGGPEPLALPLGTGGVVPGLEQGLLGAKKGEIRRIIVPSSLGYDGVAGALLPTPNDTEAQRALDSVVKNPRRDAALLFDVKVVRIK
ncbi:hypothetical protein M885DRAFT_553074 [Pelagophyceae sp. CCMP2097]|nr:hypothetical protein M885DRAFT_553074 [Pelagophyceae sp. CCMP2097]